MIELFASLALVQAAPAVQDSFAFSCVIEGTFDAAGKFTAFDQKRTFGFAVEKAGSQLKPVRTYDPSRLLGGRNIEMFTKAPGAALRYGGFTSLPTADPGAKGVTLTPTQSTEYNDWKVLIGAVKKPQDEGLNVGRCLLMDGVSASTFEKFMTMRSESGQ